MKRFFCFVALAFTVCSAVNAQLLYKISGNGLTKASYIIGTHHLADGNFAQKIPGVAEALANTDQVYGELAMVDESIPDSMAYMQKALMLPEGKTIKDVLTEEEFTKLNKFMTSYVGADFTNPVLMQQMGQFSPKALEYQLSIVLYLLKHQGEFDPTNQFDTYFQTEAQKAGKPAKGLETIKFQMETLFNSKNPKRDVELLMCLCDNAEWSEMATENLTKAFYNQDIEEIERSTDEDLNNSCDSTPEEEAELLYNRNNNWMKQLPGIMAEHPTFFAVGCAHLCGEKGLLALLRNAGYTVEGVR